MPERRNVARQLRSLCGTLAAICLFAAAVLYALTRYTQLELEGDAARSAHRLVVDRIEPLLAPADAKGPIPATRYQSLSASFRPVLADGPSETIRLWDTHGTALFADKPDAVGRRQIEVRDEIKLLSGGASRSMVVDGDRFRTLTMLRIGESQTQIVIGLDRPHAPIVAKSKARWYRWIEPAIVAAAVCFALWALAALAVMLLPKIASVVSRRRTRVDPSSIPPPPNTIRPAKRPRRGPGVKELDLPAYMLPGFREEVEARRRLEEELEIARRERDALLERVRRMESDPEDGRQHQQRGSEAGSRV